MAFEPAAPAADPAAAPADTNAEPVAEESLTADEAIATGINATVYLKQNLPEMFAGSDQLPAMIEAVDQALQYLGRAMKLIEGTAEETGEGAPQPPAPAPAPAV